MLAPLLAKQVARKARKEHYPAPYAIIEVWQRSGGGVQARWPPSAAVVKLAATPTARNLMRVYFLQERLKGQGGKDHGIKQRARGRRRRDGRRHRGLVGLQGFRGHLQDREQQFIDGALARAHELFTKKVKDEDKRAGVTARLKTDLDGAGVADADLVIEAIIENPEAKRALYRRSNRA